MREKLNENPVMQLVFIGLLAAVVGFMLFTRVLNQGGGEAATEAAPVETAAPASAAAPAVDASGAVAPTPTATTDGAGIVPAAPTAKFKAGPGLPKAVVEAYDSGQVIALLIVRGPGIDDQLVRRGVESLRGRDDTELFVARAARIARYSRITRGVDVERTPALVVVRPKSLTDGPLPTATVEYGARGVGSIGQAVRDALYQGREDLPYYPE